MQTSGQLEDLIARVRTRAEAEADELRDRAGKVAEREVARVEAEWQARKAEAEARVAQTVSAKREAAKAEIALGERRSIMRKKESAVEVVFADALAHLSAEGESEARGGLLLSLVREGIAALETDVVRVTLNEADRRLAMVGNLFGAVTEATVRLDDETSESAGGALLSDASGRLAYDNTFEARLERRRDALRAMAADLLGLRNEEGSA